MIRPLRTALFALPVALLASSCFVISTGSSKSVSGQFVGAETLGQIQPGDSKDYVLAVLGDPTSQTVVDDWTEIWRWRYRETRKTRGHVLILFNNDSSSEREHSTYVQFENGAVSRAWRD
ncbi:MAG: outer membrane protein assembly factor BamE [Planctomycetota bacterium]